MPVTKEFREFFLRHTQVNSGAKADQETGFPLQYLINGTKQVFNRFLKNDYPSESVFKKLFESQTFKLNQEDTAKLAEQGLVKIATDANAESRTSNATNDFTASVVPHQLPEVIVTNDGVTDSAPVVIGTDAGVRVTSYRRTLAGLFKKIFKVEVVVQDSVVIDGATKMVKLDGDVAIPADGFFYGKTGGAKGWSDLYTYIGTQITNAINALILTLNGAKNSVELDAGDFQLVGDVLAPGNSYYYGTNAAGVKGWYATPAVPILGVNEVSFNSHSIEGVTGNGDKCDIIELAALSYATFIAGVGGTNSNREEWTVPIGVTSIQVELWSGAGNGSGATPAAMSGSFGQAILATDSGDFIKCYAGQKGGDELLTLDIGGLGGSGGTCTATTNTNGAIGGNGANGTNTPIAGGAGGAGGAGATLGYGDGGAGLAGANLNSGAGNGFGGKGGCGGGAYGSQILTVVPGEKVYIYTYINIYAKQRFLLLLLILIYTIQ